MYKTCMDRGQGNNTAALLAFMRAHGMNWPGTSAVGVHPLDVVLDLLVNFGLSYWFRMSLMKLPGRTRYSILVDGTQYSRVMLKLAELTKSSGKRYEVSRALYQLHGYNVKDATLENLLENEIEILKTLSYTVNTTSTRSTLRAVALEGIHLVTPHISSNDWLANFNKHLAPHNVLPTDELLLEDEGVLERIDNLFAKFQRSDLVLHLGWRFIQDSWEFATPRELPHKYKDEDTAKAARSHECYADVECFYRHLLFQDRAAILFGKENLKNFTFFLEDIVSHTSDRLKDVTWMDDGVRAEAYHIVSQIRLEPWSVFDIKRKNASSLSSVYRNFPSKETPYLLLWMNTAEVYRKDVTDWPLDDTLPEREIVYSELIRYEYWKNSVFTHLAAFMPPLFYPDGNLATNYAGLGALFAKQVVKAFGDRVRPG